MATYGYDKNTDYTKLINEAVAAGDYRTAAIREAQRNEKVRGENLTQYQTTNHYADYLPRTDQVNEYLDKLGKSEWDYELDNDPAWKAYRKQYLREADRGTRDTMAAAASMTGGVPSTAAVQAGQQAGNYYRSQLTDKIPELMQNDYARYMQGREADRADLDLLFNIDEQREKDSWDKQQWEYEKQNNAWQQAMNRWAVLGYADQAVADALGVPVGTSTQDAAYQQKQAEYQQWQQQQSERGDAYDRAMTMIKIGVMPDAATLAAAGLDEATARAMLAKILEQMAQGNYSSGGGGGGGGSSGGKSSSGGKGGKGNTGNSGNTGGKGNTDPLDQTQFGTGVSQGQYTSIEDELLQYLNAYRTSGSNLYYSKAKDLLDRWQSKLSRTQAKQLLTIWQNGLS